MPDEMKKPKYDPPPNEVVVSAAAWRNSVPHGIEAIFGDPDIHHDFMQHYGIPAHRVPYLEFNPNNWNVPFYTGY